MNKANSAKIHQGIHRFILRAFKTAIIHADADCDQDFI